ncbi:MAG: hypothetical protein J3Q66DRAFT_408686 [Benniella sp.]|nr:MAG: hypothetical protein J3Q66DRAFT_408686 [Benniella sp.]
MPKAPRHTTNQVGSAAKRPAYQAWSHVRTTAPAPVTASGSGSATTATSDPAPAAVSDPAAAPAPNLVVAPAAPPARRFVDAESTGFTHAFGSKVIKMFLVVHVFTTKLRCGAGPLTEERRNQTAANWDLPTMNRSIGCSYRCLSPDISLWEFALIHDLQGYTTLGQYLHDYRSCLTAADIDVGPESPEIQQVEAIIGYPFRNKRLIEEVLTLPGNGVRRDYERLEFLGDSVLDVLAATAWIDEGAPFNQIHTRTETTVSNATLTVAGLEVGLEAFMRNCPQYKRNEINLTRTSLADRRKDNKVYWTKNDEVKALADVVEAVLGAVFLDSGMQLLDVENVSRRILLCPGAVITINRINICFDPHTVARINGDLILETGWNWKCLILFLVKFAVQPLRRHQFAIAAAAPPWVRDRSRYTAMGSRSEPLHRHGFAIGAATSPEVDAFRIHTIPEMVLKSRPESSLSYAHKCEWVSSEDFDSAPVELVHCLEFRGLEEDGWSSFDDAHLEKNQGFFEAKGSVVLGSTDRSAIVIFVTKDFSCWLQRRRNLGQGKLLSSVRPQTRFVHNLELTTTTTVIGNDMLDFDNHNPSELPRENEKRVRTQTTFEAGASWQYIMPPRNMGRWKALPVHSKDRRIMQSSPSFTEFGHDDGGISWKTAPEHPYKYVFDDQGALIVATRDDNVPVTFFHTVQIARKDMDGKCELEGKEVMPDGECRKEGDTYFGSSSYRKSPMMGDFQYFLKSSVVMLWTESKQFWRSADDGSTWKRIVPDAGAIYDLFIHAENENHVYLFTAKELLDSHNNRETFGSRCWKSWNEVDTWVDKTVYASHRRIDMPDNGVFSVALKKPMPQNTCQDHITSTEAHLLRMVYMLDSDQKSASSFSTMSFNSLWWNNASILHSGRGCEYGRLFKSTSEATQFSLQLDNTNRNSMQLVDWEKIGGIERVILANHVINIDSLARDGAKHIHTLVSFFGSGSWAPIGAPTYKNCRSDECFLHLHSATNYNGPGAVFSASSSVSLVMGVGNIGRHLLPLEKPQAYLRRDAGRTWKQVSNKRQLYEFGDEGGVLVLADPSAPTGEILYSSPPQDRMSAQTSNLSSRLLIFASRRDYVLDQNNTEKSDFEKWSLFDDEDDRCILGKELDSLSTDVALRNKLSLKGE